MSSGGDWFRVEENIQVLQPNMTNCGEYSYYSEKCMCLDGFRINI